jgi:hypothetical protein
MAGTRILYRASLPEERWICYAGTAETPRLRGDCPRLQMSDPSNALTLQFLAWVAEDRRTYAQAMEAWRSSCPRLSIWEDAILDGLIAFDSGPTRNQSRVTLTQKGRALLRADEKKAARTTTTAAPRVGELVR